MTGSIDSLPVEISQMILTEWDALYPTNFDDGFPLDSTGFGPGPCILKARPFYDALACLRLVSHRFHDTIAGYPHLWRRVDYALSPAQRRLIWQNSAEIPLLLHFLPDSLVDPIYKVFGRTLDNHAFAQYVQEISSQSHRWKAMSLTTTVEDLRHPLMQQVLGSAAPSLESLYYRVERPWQAEENEALRPLFQNIASPRTIIVEGNVRFEWTPVLISRLRRLSIDQNTVKYNGEPRSFLDIIHQQGFPQLRELSLDREAAFQMSYPVNDGLTMTLPQLLHLRTSYVTAPLLRMLFTKIQIPISTAISVDHVDHCDDVGDLLWLAEWFGSHLPASSDDNTLKITAFGNSGLSKVSHARFVHRTGGVGTIRLGLRETVSYDEFLEVCRTILGSAPSSFRQRITRLGADMIPGGLPLAWLVRTIGSLLPNVTHLSVKVETYWSVAEALAATDDAPLALPNLKTFHALMWIDTPGRDSLLSALKGRSLDAVELRPQVDKPYPAVRWEKHRGVVTDLPSMTNEQGQPLEYYKEMLEILQHL